MLKIKLLKILVLLFAIEYVMSKTYLIETTAEEENGKYYTNTRKVICYFDNDKANNFVTARRAPL